MVQIRQIVSQITTTAQAYYEGAPTISDQEFDGLVELLRSVSPAHPILSVPGWGYNPRESDQHLKEVPHLFKVGGLFKVKHQDFLKRKSMPLPDGRVLASLKLDGGSAVAYYCNGKLERVVSRGDGVNGFDITANLIPGGTVPQRIHKSIIAVRGEVVVLKSDATKLNSNAPRNLAVGLSQSVHNPKDRLEHLKFVAYALYRDKIPAKDLPTQFENMNHLTQNQFMVVPHRSFRNSGEFYDYVNTGKLSLTRLKNMCYGQYDLSYDFPIDGLVVTSNEPALTPQSVAYKFDDETSITKVESIEWNTSRTGRVVPVANVTPTVLTGAVIKRVTMNNISFLETTGAGVGAEITIVRSNMVIPRWVNTAVREEVTFPTECPVCQQKLVRESCDLICKNTACDAKDAGARLQLWNFNKPDGIGPSIINQVEDTWSLFSIQEIKLWSKEVDTWQPLGPPNGIGQAAFKLIVDTAKSINKFQPTFGQILAMANIPQVGQSVQSAIESVTTKESIAELRQAGSPPVSFGQKGFMNKTAWLNLNSQWHKVTSVLALFELKVVPTVSVLQLVKVCLTGSLSKPRPALLKDWATLGVQDASANACDVLVADGPSDSAKYRTAVKRGIPILTEPEFVAKYLPN